MTTPARRLISVITVTYNCAPLAVKALRSAEAAAAEAGVDVELVVVDNASVDDSVARVRSEFPQANVIANAENRGFGRANNQAFEVATGDYWLLLNPDAALSPPALGRLVDFLDGQPAVAAVAPSVRPSWGSGMESGGMTPGLRSLVGHFFLVNRVLWADRGGAWRGVHLRRRPRLGPRPVDWVSAAAVLLRPEAVRQVGGFDPTFFMYGEDLDLGRRLGAEGWRLFIHPDATADHIVAGTQDRVSTQWVDAVHNSYGADASRSELLVFDMVMAVGLVVRGIVASMRSSESHAASRVRARAMLSSARRAWQLAARP